MQPHAAAFSYDHQRSARLHYCEIAVNCWSALPVQVAQDIKKLSKVKPQLPWSAADTNIRKPKPAAAAAASKGGAGFGGGKAGFGKKAAAKR
jgi:hypothetical protein